MTKIDKPLWDGPESNTPQGGVTQSLLCGFLSCRERFRVGVIEGLRTADTFDHRLEFGNMHHLCEETFAGSGNPIVSNTVTPSPWEVALKKYAQTLCAKYPTQQEQVQHWYNVCKVTFPLYINYWKKHPDNSKRTSIVQEKIFSVPYKLPSGRTVYLRGKWDGVALEGKGKSIGIILDEHKTKGDIEEQQIKRQLSFDIQTMTYIVALQESMKNDKRYWEQLSAEGPIKGVRYNVIRRPLSGGEGSIRQHKPTKSNPRGETKDEFYNRLSGIIKDAVNPDGTHRFFMRWKVEIIQADIDKFKKEFLNPVLEQLCDWYDWVTSGDSWDTDRAGNCYIHWRHPFNVYNVLDQGGYHELDEYLNTGSKLGLVKSETLFSELEH